MGEPTNKNDEDWCFMDDGDTADSPGEELLAPFPQATRLQRQRSTETALQSFLQEIGLESFSEALQQMGVMTLTDVAFLEYEDLISSMVGMNVIQARKLIRARDKNIAEGEPPAPPPPPPPPPPKPAPVVRVPSSQLQHSGLILQKGHLPFGPQFTEKQLKRIQNRRYDPDSNSWVKREEPLTTEELECWQEQAAWLKCPITGKEWIDADTILGVGIYHAPRQVTEAERQRMFAWEKVNAVAKQQQQEGVRTSGDQPWWSTFYVYPNVDPPSKPFEEEALPPIGEDENVSMGRVELIIGPAFDVSAYNIGVHGGALPLPDNEGTTAIRSKAASRRQTQ